MTPEKLWSGILILTIFVGCYLMFFFIFESTDDVTPILLREIPDDHPYRPILKVDNETHFLDSQVRDFLAKSKTLAVPKKYRAVINDLLLEFDRVWRQELNRSYMLYAGTLMGAVRHGEQIPWDDDLDIVVDIKYNKTVRYDFERSSAGRKLNISRGGPFRKIWFNNNLTKNSKFGHWPFIDLFFYKFKYKGAKIRVPPYAHEYDVKEVFPPSEIFYLGRKFPSPRCYDKFLKHSFPSNYMQMCVKHAYSHREEEYSSTHDDYIECSKLHGHFQFAKYQRINKTHVQLLLSLQQTEPLRIAQIKSGEEEWTNGSVLRMPVC